MVRIAGTVGTLVSIVGRISEALSVGLQRIEVRERIAAIGGQPGRMTPTGLATYPHPRNTRWKKLFAYGLIRIEERMGIGARVLSPVSTTGKGVSLSRATFAGGPRRPTVVGLRAQFGQGPTIDLRSIALDRYRGMLPDRARRFAAQKQMRRVHVEAHRAGALERVGLVDSGLARAQRRMPWGR